MDKLITGHYFFTGTLLQVWLLLQSFLEFFFNYIGIISYNMLLLHRILNTIFYDCTLSNFQINIVNFIKMRTSLKCELH